ncbi:MAG: hypothetical protein ACRDYU_00005 [Actinomycetes bacterium]
MASQLAEGSVRDRNVRPLLSLLGRYVGCEFDSADWDRLLAALEATDDSGPDSWYVHPFPGERPVEVRLAQAAGSGVVSVRVTGPDDPELAMQARTLVDVYRESED